MVTSIPMMMRSEGDKVLKQLGKEIWCISARVDSPHNDYWVEVHTGTVITGTMIPYATIRGASMIGIGRLMDDVVTRLVLRAEALEKQRVGAKIPWCG